MLPRLAERSRGSHNAGAFKVAALSPLSAFASVSSLPGCGCAGGVIGGSLPPAGVPVPPAPPIVGAGSPLPPAPPTGGGETPAAGVGPPLAAAPVLNVGGGAVAFALQVAQPGCGACWNDVCVTV